MLLIFKTPTELVKDAQGNPIPRPGPRGSVVYKIKAKRDAGEAQSLIEAVCPCEHGPTFSHTREGAKRGTLQAQAVLKWRESRSPVRVEDLPKARATANPVFDALYVEETETRVVNELPEPASDEVWVSPTLVKKDGSPVTIADFPDGWSFGNGVSCGVTVRLKDGTEVIVNWCVIPQTQRATALANLTQIREAMEV